ncbi:MAG: caspase family protein [Thermoguttaceae bacterium]|nr:caspase family protein [Thermoguttaceae bacterium]
MSHSGKRFLSDLVNRVFSSNTESRATAKRRERSLSARRLGMEPLEDRQLLSVDPTLLGAASQAEVSLAAATPAVDLSAISQDASNVVATTGVGATLSVGEGKFEETLLNQSTDYAVTLDVSNAASEDTTGTRLIKADLNATIFDRLSCDQMTWAATLANMLTYTGWSVTSVVDDTVDRAPEQQTLDYFTSSFTNDPSNLALAYAWFMGGPSEYTYQDVDIWAQILPNCTNGGLFPTSSGEYQDPSYYCKEFRAAEIASPLYGISTDYLDNNWAVGCEIHYMNPLGNDVETGNPGQAKATWLTLWGYDYDSSYEPTDPEYYTAVYMSDPNTGATERMTIEWNNMLNSYVLTNFGNNVSGQVPYIYSFTVLQRMPGYGVLIPDQYEPNNSAADFETPDAVSDLGKVDVLVPSSTTGSTANGNTFTLDNLTLYAQSSIDGFIAADPVDFYKFELTQTASHSDSIVVSFNEGYLNSPLKATLFVCGDDGEAYPIDPVEYGYVGDHFDAVPRVKTEYFVGEDGKTYFKTTNQLTLDISGLTAGYYYLKVEFADGVVGGVNSGYSITFNAGYDDLYESNDSFEEVDSLPVDAPNKPSSNFGVLYGRKFVEDLVLKQYDPNISETDWYRFEMAATGKAGDYVRVYYNSTTNDINDADLDFVLYKKDPDDPYGRGYTMVDRSWEVMTDVEEVSLEGLEAGVYYVKVVGNLAAEDGTFVNVEYKLEILPGVDENLPPDLRAEVLPTNNWEGPLVVAVDRYVPSDTEQFKSESYVGIDGNVYLNYSFAVYGAQTKTKTATYENVELGLFINGVRVSADDLRAAILNSGLVESKATQMLDLFCNGGMTMKAGEAFECINFNIGKIADSASLAGTYFDSSVLAANSVVIVINPDNYTYGEDFAKVVDDFTVTEESLTYRDGKFYDGSIVTSVAKGATVKVFRNNKFVKTLVYGVDEFEFKNGDAVITEIVKHNYGVNTTDYVVNEGVLGVLEYMVDNNFASAYFVLDNLSEDVFAPNASVTDVMNNTNVQEENPDLGVVNIEYLDQGGVCHIDNLVITGKKDSNGAYISDWFKFNLLTGDEDKAKGVTNYEDAYVEIEMGDGDDFIDPSREGDLDLYLYKVVQTDDTISFDEAFAEGSYRLVLVAQSKDVSSTERIDFSDYDIDDGTYFVCVSGFNGASNRYSLEIGGFTAAGDILPTDPNEYFTDDSVKILNSVATLNWRVPTTDYVSRVIISYRAAGTDEWIEAGQYKPSVTTCKIAGLAPDTEYEFRLTVTNYFVQDDPLSATVTKKTADYLNEVVYRAIIVGVSDYPGASADLVAAANDANAFRDALLKDPQWAEENITLLVNDNATKSNVLDAIASVGYVSDDNDVLVFYFAGSGTYAVTGGSTVGYLKTYGSTRSAYLSSSELAAAVSQVAAGSKQFILDAGQVTAGLEETSINYDAFINSLKGMTANGASDRAAQVAVLTSGENGALSHIGQGSRSIFSQTLVDAMAFYSAVVTPDDLAAATDVELTVTDHQPIVSDGRVAIDELADYMNSDIRFKAYEMSAMTYCSTPTQAIMMNGYWSENDAYAQDWLDANAIVVTTTVDTVDEHDGKISLREAANLIGTFLNRETTLKNGDRFTLGAGSVVTVGTYTGILNEDVDLTYSNGSFRTAGPASLEVGTKTVDYAKGGVAVSWTAEDWEAGNVKLADEAALAVADVTFKLRATIGSTIVDKEEFATVVDLEEGDELYTAPTNGKVGVVTKIGQTYKVVVDGVVYNKTTGLYRKTVDEEGADVYEAVTLSTYAVIDQDVEMTKIIFDDSLAGQAITVNTAKGAIVFDNGAIIDATSLKGELSFDGLGENSLLKISGTKLVSLIGVKITNSNGAAIIVDEGADFELANSLVYRNNCGLAGLFANAGNMTFTNVTIANNNVNNQMFMGGGTAVMTNSIVALNVAGLSGFEYGADSFVGGSEVNPGFVAAENDDYTLVKTSDAVDIGDNTAVNLRCGVVLDYDLAGAERYAVGGTIDAGAFEYSVPMEDRETPSTVVTILEDIVDATDGEISLREAVAYAGTTYQIQTTLNEGDTVTDPDGNIYQVKAGRLVSFEGVSAVQYGMYYTIEGVYIVDAYGESTALDEGEVVTLANGSSATVVGTKLLYASGVPVEGGAAITRADGSTGTLSYGAIVDFARNERIAVALTQSVIDPSTPVGDFDAGTYVLTYQPNGTFKATLHITTTDSSNNSTTTDFEATFKLVANTPFAFLDETDAVTATGKIATSRAVDLENGKYVLLNAITETIDGKKVIIYEAGAQFTLTDGVFTDADGYTVAVPKGTQFTAPTGATVAYQFSNFVPANIEEGTELTDSEGVTRQYKEGLTLYEEVTLGRNITFKKGLEGGTVTLDRGAIAVERAVTIDAALNSGLTVDANNASRAFTVNTYREANPSATVLFNGMTIVNGAAEEGGLIYVAEGSNFKITDSTLSNATATRGGAIYNAGKTTVEAASKTTSITNVTAEEGGAVYNTGSLTLAVATVSDVSATGNGGAVYNAGTASLAGAKISNATAGGNGGAVYNTGVLNVTKSANISNSSAQYGGAIYNENTVTVANSTLQGNSAAANGGALYNAAGKATFSNVKALGNSAAYGGAVYDTAQFFAVRTVFAENTTSVTGAAVYTVGNATVASSLVEANGLNDATQSKNVLYAWNGGKLTLVNDTVAGNMYAGVFANEANVVIYNTILGDNNGTDLGFTGSVIDVQYSMVQTTNYSLSSTNIEYAPNFKSYDPAADWTTWSLMPGSGSAAIDAASVDYAYYYNFNGAKTALTVDFLGNSRISGEGVDVGAYEASEISEDASTVVTTLDDIVDPTDGLVSLREAIRYASTGTTVAERTVTFSNDLFPITNDATVYLDSGLGTIVIGTSVIVTAAYTDEFGETAYRNITVDGTNSDTSLFMLVDGADAEMRGLTFANGKATGENPNGGAFNVRGGELRLVDSVLTGNTAARNGGAIAVSGGSIFVVNSLINDNTADETRGYGGAIFQNGGQAYIYNTTIAANDAAVYGGVFSSDGVLVLANSIVAENGGAQSVDVYATNLEATSNLIGAMDAWRSVNGMNGNIVGTPTNVVDPRFGENFHLESDSLAINSGLNAYAYGPDGVRLKLDLDAKERIIGGVVDMGCYESGMADVPSTVVTSLNDNIDQEDGYITLREAIAYSNQYGTPITFDFGDDFEGDAIIYLESGAIDVTSKLVIDASSIPGGVTIVGNDDRVFFVHKSGTILEDGSVTSAAGELVLKNVALTGGDASRGGAVIMDGGELNFTNVLIYGNTADEIGGAIYATGGAITMLNCTVAGNSAEDYPGLYSTGPVSLQNTIVAANATENSSADHNFDLYVTGKLSSIASIVGATDAATASAFDGYNGNTYGIAEAIVDPGFTDPDSNDFTLKQDSIAVNGGSNRLIGLPGYYASILQTAANVQVIRTDYAGNERLVGGTVDIGAYELQLVTESPSVVVTTLADVVDPFDGEISLREAIDYAGSQIHVDGVTTRVGRTITFKEELANGVITLAEPLEIQKCVTVDATDLVGTLTIDAAGEFGAIVLNGKADSVQNEIFLCGVTITGGDAEYGAGVYHVGGAATLFNCVVTGNKGTFGAGVASVARVSDDSDNELSLINCTVAGNDATGGFAGVWSVGGPVYIANTIIAENTTNGELGTDVSISNVDKIEYSIISVAPASFARTYDGVDFSYVGRSDSPVDPAFTDSANGDYTLTRGDDGFVSLAINGGNNSLAVLPDGSVPATDAGTSVRIIGSQVDMGAYESAMGPTELPSLMVTTLDDVIDAYDGLISLREAVLYANNYGLKQTIVFAQRLSGGTIYLNESLNLSNDITIDGLANDVTGITLTTADSVEDQSVIYANAGDSVINGLTITNRYTERRRAGGEPQVDKGGAVFVRSGSISLYNCLLADNAAATGSAIYINPDIDGATVNLVNTTVVSNVGQTTDPDKGAAIYGEKGGLNLWNSIVASSSLATGGVAQDVYKGTGQLAKDTVVTRASDVVTMPVYDTSKVYTPSSADKLKYYSSTALILGWDAVYEDGVFYEVYSSGSRYAINFTNGQCLSVGKDKTVQYFNGGWYDEGVAYELALDSGESAMWYDASTDTTQEVRYYFGTFYTASSFRIVQLADGDRLTFTEPQYYVYQDGTFYGLNLSGSGRMSVTNAVVKEYTEQLTQRLQEQLDRQTEYQKVVNGVVVTYPIVSGTATVTGLSTNVSMSQEGDGTNYDVMFTYTVTYDYTTRVSSNVFNTFVGFSDTLAAQTSGNGSYIGSSDLDLSGEVASMFVDVDNADYRLRDGSLATNGGNNTYINQGTINGTFDSFDIQGNKRIYYTTIDMGAFENQSARDSAITSVSGDSATLTVSTYRDVVDPTDGVTSFREALQMADKMYALGYANVVVEFADDYMITVDNTLGTLTVNSPMSIVGNGATIDADHAGCALNVATDGDVVLRTLIIANGTSGDGAGINFTRGNLTLDDCLIYNCEASGKGGAIYDASTGTLNLYNTTVAKNTSVEGNGIYATRGTNVNLYNTIVATNRSSVTGADSYDVALAGTYSINNSLIGNAGTSAYAAILSRYAVNSKIGYGIDNSIDPLFINASGGNFRISATQSPAKNAGAAGYVYDGSYDLDGNYLPGRMFVSMGAYQIGLETPSLVVTTLEDIVDATDGLISLREALEYTNYWGDNIHGNGMGTKMYNHAYNSANAMNNAGNYSATYYAPVTFDPSLAGGTIYLTSPITLENAWAGNDTYDYMIDASALNGLGGITIDTTGVEDEGFIRSNGVFNIIGHYSSSGPVYYISHLDVRNIHFVGSRDQTALYANDCGLITVRNCLLEGYRNSVTAAIDTDNDNTGCIHVYSSTIIGNESIPGLGYFYNSIVTGSITGTYTNSGNYSQIHCYSTIAVGGFYTRVSTDSRCISGGYINDLFVDYANGDYRLGDASLAINMGDNAYLFTLAPTHADAEVDLNGNTRLLNGVVDMGCYERVNFVDIPSATVTTFDDVVDPTDGYISIREALAYAQQRSSLVGGTVRFSSEFDGMTLNLDSALKLTRNVNFDGGDVAVTLNGGKNDTIFDINIPGVQANVPNVYLRNMTLTGGFTTTDGGAISIQSGNVYLGALEIYGNEARRYGGAVYAYNSELTVNDCRIGGNTAGYYGGIVNEFGKTVLTRSYVAENVSTNPNAGADIWGKAAVNYVNSKNNVVGYVADNITLYDGVDNNRVGTADNPIKPFVGAAVGNLTVKQEWVIDGANAGLDEAFTLFAEDEDAADLTVDFGDDLNVFDDDLFDELEQF